jgi:hypothetical protein
MFTFDHDYLIIACLMTLIVDNSCLNIDNNLINILTSNNIHFEVMSCNFSVIFDNPIICKTVIYIDKSDNSSWREVGFDTYRFDRLITDWSVQNMNIKRTTKMCDAENILCSYLAEMIMIL